MALRSFKDPIQPGRPSRSEWDTPADMLLRARTHEALAGSLAEKAARLDPDRARPALYVLWAMARTHRIRAMLLRGHAACGADDGSGIREPG
ncbi:hypothetical protein SAMN02799622_02972 [Methylobacterium sp. UNC378MF]|nr:hypothetical protein SAMN02799622_02972 [Methylobacterium sp. UNC378MF]